MSEVLRIAATVGTPLALLGLVVALGYYAYSRRLKYEEKKLEALPPDERATRTDEYLTRYGIDGKKLRLADKLALIRDELEKRHRRSFGYVIVAAVVFTVCFGLAVLAFIVRPSPTSAITPPVDTRLTALTLHQELSKVRDVLSQPPRQDRPPPEKYPHPYESGELAKWNEPRSSSINQIVMLAEIDPHAVFRALVPLLSDSDGVVVAGALYALRDIITQKPDEKKHLDKLIPKGDDAFLKHELRLNLRDTYIVNQDFSALAGVDLFYAAQFQGAVLENVTFDGLVLKRSDFGRSTILECSFRNTDLERSSWRDARVRSTDFTGANMFSMFAHSADFGRATSDPTTLFPGNRFLNAMLNDADLNRASMVGADLERASLNSAQFVGADFTDAYFDGTLVSEQLLRGAGVVLLNEETKYGRGQRP